jgi:hypothetical protein
MKNYSVKIFLMVVLGLAIISCRVAPVYNVEDAAIVSTSGNDLTMDQVKTAIMQAGTALGWTMKPVSDGHIVGTLFVRRHMAKVDINYSTKSYSISYKDSQELQYDGNQIHSNYNGWVQNLQRNIDGRLTAM